MTNYNKTIMENRTKHILQFAQTVEHFTAAQYMQNAHAEMSDAALHSVVTILNRMVREGRLQRVQRGLYAQNNLSPWQVVLTPQEKAVYDMLQSQFPLLQICTYNGETFAPLQHHLAFNQATYVEVERDGVEAVFHCLQDAGYETYKTPNEQMAYDYIDIRKKIIIVKPLVTQAPLTKQDGCRVPTLEKLLVDIRADKDFYYMQGIEASYMTDTARQLYVINEQKLQRYAKRRNVAIIDNR